MGRKRYAVGQYATDVTRVCANPGCGRQYHPYGPYAKVQKICGALACKAWQRKQVLHRLDGVIDRAKYMDPEELKAFMAAAQAQGKGYWYWCFRLAVNACLRIGEIKYITPSSFRLDEDPPTVNVCTLKRRGRPVLAVDIDRATATGVLAYAKAAGIGPHSPIFPLGKQSIRNAFLACCRAAKLTRRYKPHALRHTGILLRARAAKSVEDLEWLRQSARHSDIKMTALYLHTASGRRKELVRRVPWA